MTYPTTYSDRLTVGCVVSIKRRFPDVGFGPWYSPGNAYNYGIGEPHYSVPAIHVAHIGPHGLWQGDVTWRKGTFRYTGK